ncbi:MAG: hypothetical protein VKP72_07140 [bacterium]|nr:hypothetical protein [bacterium]
MRKFLPLALVAATLSGCLAINKAQSLTSGGVTPFLARSVTLADTVGAGAVSTVILVWGAAPSSLQRTGGGVGTKSNFNLSSVTDTDTDVQPGQTYTYVGKFGGADKTRIITTANVATLQSPNLTAPVPVSTQAVTPTSEKQPTVSWTAGGSPAGFLVSVNVLPGLTGTGDADAAGTPVYTAFIDGPKHLADGVYSIAYGSKSDLTSFSDDVMTALKQADGKGRFDAKDDGIAPLEAGKAYAVLVLPIAADQDAINVGFGKPALGNWLIQ